MSDVAFDLRSFVLGTLAAAAVTIAFGMWLWPASPPPRDRRNEAPPATTAVAPQTGSGDDSAPSGAAGAERDAAIRESIAELRTVPAWRSALADASTRLEQVQAIAALLADGSPEALQALLDAFLASHDKVLLALIEEALLHAPEGIVPNVMAAFRGARDAEQLARLANLLRAAGAQHPAVAERIGAFLVEALDDPDSEGSGAAFTTLEALGRAAIAPLAERLRAPGCGVETAGAIASLFAKLPADCSELVRDRLREGFDAFRASLGDSLTSDDEKVVARKKTGSFAVAAASRWPAEQDQLAMVFAEALGNTTDAPQAGTLAWGLGNLQSLTDTGRTNAALSLLGALPHQRDSAVRRIIARAITNLALGAGVAAGDALRGAIESATTLAPNAAFRAELQQILTDFDAGRRGR